MNKTFQMIWSKVKAAWVIVSEVVTSNGGPAAITVTARQAGFVAAKRAIHAAFCAATVSGAAMLFAPCAFALPTNPQVISGTANIQTAGTMMNITNSPNAIINWGSFSIANNETARFIQQSASSNVLNRVIGGDPSQIYGALQSNGKVFLINQNGIFIGPNARIDVGGLVASTLNISNQDFLAGKMQFGDATPAGKLENQGMITTPNGGQVYLIAPDVTNKGTITTPNGEVLLAAGKEVLLVESTTPEIAFVVSAPEDQAINLGTIAADVGKVGMYGSMVRNSGTISANSATMEGGKIYLRATKKIELAETSKISADGVKGGEIIAMTAENNNVTGELIARGSISAKGDGTKNSGGFIETSAAKLDLHGVQINTNGGTWLIDPVDITIGDVNDGGNITGEAVSEALGSNNVTISSTDNGNCEGIQCSLPQQQPTGDGNITVASAITWESDKKLTLEAHKDININAAITGASGTLELKAGEGDVNGGSVTQTANGVIEAGTLNVTAKGNITLNQANNKVSSFGAKSTGTSGTISFVNNAPLTITGAVSSTDKCSYMPAISIVNNGDIYIQNSITTELFRDSDVVDVELKSNNGLISQNENGTITTRNLKLTTYNGAELDQANNKIQSFSAINEANGDIKLKNSIEDDEFNILSISQNATNGKVEITSTKNGVVVGKGSTAGTITSKNGNITITSTSETGNCGVYISKNSEITTSGGSVTIDGASTDRNGGVSIQSGSKITTSGGDISITGTGGTSLSNDSGTNGVYIGGATINSGEGSITIEGTGATGNNNGSYGVSIIGVYGINDWNYALITGENITITGTGGTGNYSGGEGVVVNWHTDINASDKLTIDGTGGNDSAGVYLVGEDISVTGGEISITGKGGNAEIYTGGIGVVLNGEGTSVTGSEIAITGIGGKGGDGDNGSQNGGEGGGGVALNDFTYNNNAPLTITGTKGTNGAGFEIDEQFEDEWAAYAVRLTESNLYTETSALNIIGTDTNDGKDILINYGSAVGLLTDDQNSTTLQPGDISFEGNLFNSDSSLGVGAGSTINIAGNYTQSDPESHSNDFHSKLYVAIADNGAFSKLNVSGNVSLDGTLNVKIDGNYATQPGAYFPFLTATGDSTGTFAKVDFNNTANYEIGYNLAEKEAARIIYTAGAKTFTNTNNNLNWGETSNWSGSSLPGQNDHVLLSSGYAVNHSTGTDAIAALTINGGSNALNVSGGSLTVTGATTVDGELQTSGNGTLTLNGLSGGGTLGLAGDGILTLNGASTIANYEQTGGTLNGNGSFTVTDSIATSGGEIYAKFADLNFTQSSGVLDLGTKITNTGNVIIKVPNGKLTLNNQITASDGITLYTGEAFINNKGAGALQAGEDNYWQIWSTNPEQDTLGGLDYGFKQYGAVFEPSLPGGGGTTPPGGGFGTFAFTGGSTALLGEGNALLYSVTPELTLNVTDNIEKTYDGTTTANIPSANISLTGSIGNDVVTLGNDYYANYADKNAGTGKTVKIDNISATATSSTGKPVYGYTIPDEYTASSIGTINKADLQITNGTASDKVYDGTTLATVNGGQIAAITGDDVALSLSSASFEDKNAGDNKKVNVSYTISGDDAANYNLLQQSDLTANISKKDLTVSGITAQDKVYDGTTLATVNGGQIAAITGDDVALSLSSASFEDKNAGDNKKVNASYTISGDDAANYNLLQQSDLTANISKKDLTVSGITAQDKEYDGTSIAEIDTSGAKFNGIIDGDDLAVAANGYFADENIGENKIVTLASNYSGTDKDNYNITDQTQTVASIKAQPDPGTPDPGTPDPGTPDPGTPDPGTPDPGTPDPGTPDPVPPIPTTPQEQGQVKTETGQVTNQITKETSKQSASAVAPAGLELVGMDDAPAGGGDSGEAAASGGETAASGTTDESSDSSTDDEDKEKQEAREEQQSGQDKQDEKPTKNYCN